MGIDLAVVGLGRVGTPLAVLAAVRGLNVVGLDIDGNRVDVLNAGDDPFGDEADFAKMLERALAGGRLTATTNAKKAIAEARAVIVAVPLWLADDHEPDFRFLDTAVETIASEVTPGTVVIFETTQPVGTTERRHTPHLTDVSGLDLGRDLFVAFSPERIKVGHVFRDLDRYPKIVGGVDDASTEQAADLYRSFLPEVWTVRNSKTAEFVKLAETAYRDLNIALAHELGDAADRSGVDFSAVRRAANSQPESDLHLPGIGVGGHCIPVYPYLFMHGTPGLELIAHGRTLNEHRPERYAALLETEIGDLKDRRVAVLGAAYRPELGLIEHSSVFALVTRLTALGAVVEVFEPHASFDELRRHGLSPASRGHSYDAAIIHTAHRAFRDRQWHDLAPILIDGRGLLADSPPPAVRYLAPGFLSA